MKIIGSRNCSWAAPGRAARPRRLAIFSAWSSWAASPAAWSASLVFGSPPAPTSSFSYDAPVLLADVRENGGVAQVGLPAGALVVPRGLLGIRLRVRALHIIDYQIL